MPGQGDLQDWLNQLKKRAEQQSHLPTGHSPLPVQGNRKIPSATISATDAALARLARQDEDERNEAKEEERQRLLEVKKRAAKRLAKEKAQRSEPERMQAKTGKPSAQRSGPKSPRGLPVEAAPGSGAPPVLPVRRSIFRALKGDREALRQAIILAEVLAPPKALRTDEPFRGSSG